MLCATTNYYAAHMEGIQAFRSFERDAVGPAFITLAKVNGSRIWGDRRHAMRRLVKISLSFLKKEKR